MKTIKKLINSFILIGLIFFVSCQEFLEEVPKSQASPENFYKTAEHAEAAVVGAYNALQRNGVYGHFQQYLVTDVTRTAHWNTRGGVGTYTFSSENPIIVAIWEQHFKGINEANAVITHVPGIDMDEDRKNRLVAEAKFLKSLFYFNLIRYFGDVPYFETETNSLNNLEASRDEVAFINEKIIEDLEFCIEHLDNKGNTQKGRATVGAAKTLLSKVYLTRGSMAKRDGTGNGIEDFTKARQYAGEVINSGEYSLNAYFPDAFIRENKYNDEVVFDVHWMTGGFDEGNFIGMQMGLQGPNLLGGSWGNIQATEYFNTIYEPSDMVRQEWTTPHVRVLGNGTLRTNYPDLAAQPWKIGKYRRYPVRMDNFTPRDHDLSWPVFRYAEVLLIYAEAINEVNNGPNGEVFNALNMLRERARNVNGDGTREYLHEDVLPRSLTYDPSILPDISSSEYPDYESMHEYIKLERARELGGETKRWFDLVRWGTLVEKIKFLLDYVPPSRGRTERNWAPVANNVKEHHMLLPIPFSDIQANPLLTQNTGY